LDCIFLYGPKKLDLVQRIIDLSTIGALTVHTEEIIFNHSESMFALDFFFRGNAVPYHDIPEGVSTVRPHWDSSSAAE
jgi:hypothetical protein